MGEADTLRKMIDQALTNIKQVDSYLEWIQAGNKIKMIDKTAEQSTEEWKSQLQRYRQMDAEFINGIKNDARYDVCIDSSLYPEFGTTDR